MKSIAEFQLDLLASEAADWKTTKAAEVFTKLYQIHPEAEGVMCSNDAMALGVLEVLGRDKKTGLIPVVGFDNDASVAPFIRSGCHARYH